MVRTLGWEVGGAYLTAALVENGRVSRVFREATPPRGGPSALEAALAAVLAEAGEVARHGVAVTGDIADAFATREAGVSRLSILVGERLGGEARLYAGAAGFVRPGEAEGLAPRLASANWHATAAFVAGAMDEALLLDMGAATTDLTPVAKGAVLARGSGDAERLAAGELVPVGHTRTPLPLLGDDVPFAGRRVPTTISEPCATMADALRAAGAAEGGDAPPSEEEARARLARTIGRVAGEGSAEDWAALGRAFAERAIRRVHDAALLVLSRGEIGEHASVVAAGAGRPLLRRVAARLDRGVVDFADLVDCREELRDAVRRAAPATAVALLAAAG